MDNTEYIASWNHMRTKIYKVEKMKIMNFNHKISCMTIIFITIKQK